MRWIALSPHFDDAAFSLGGFIWEQTSKDEDVLILTVCAGKPPEGDLPDFARSLHDRWGTGPQAVEVRRKEDEKSAAVLNASNHWLNVPDCIYRRDPESGKPLHNSGAAVFGPLHASEKPLVDEVSQEIAAAAEGQDATLLVPLGVGNHVDHQLTRKAAEQSGLKRLYYSDFPYIINNEHHIGYMLPKQSTAENASVSEEGLRKWQDSMAAYESQINTFWPNLEKMQAAVQAYHSQVGGIQLWRPPN